MVTVLHERDQWVLVPGTLCTPEVFGPILDHLAVRQENRRFVIVDTPHVSGYDARLRMAVTGGEIVCGFSLGAIVLAHNLGALHRAKAVVLLALNPLPDPPENRARREAVRDRVLANDARGWVTENWDTMSVDRGTQVRDVVVSMAERCAAHIPAQTELAASRPGAVNDLAASNLPLVFVSGYEDQLSPVETLYGIARSAPNTDLQLVQDLGHFALLEAPNRVASAVRAGLRTVLRETDRNRHVSM